MIIILFDNSFRSPCNSPSNELSHDIIVKGESDFWDTYITPDLIYHPVCPRMLAPENGK